MTNWRGSPARTIVAFAAAAMIGSACTSGGGPGPAPAPSRAGGTLRVGLLSADGAISGWCPMLICGRTFDPQSTSFADVFELDRCCFMRTLLSYAGISVADGGTQLRPDMARSLPAISTDGLTWTFHLRLGVRYAPPMAGTEIVAGDFIRSFERAFTTASVEVPYAHGGTIGGYWTGTYLEGVIAGVHEFTDKKADHVSGLEAPDLHTLVIHLTEPVGDLGYRLALSELGPIPSNSAHPDDPHGVAQGHDFDYGDVIVSSGPYMFEGSEKLEYALPPEDQLPPAGNWVDGATLVRNPTWSRAVDPIRKAWPDRIEFTVVGSPEEAEQLVRDDVVDVVLNWGANAATTARWLDDPDLRPRIVVAPADGMHFLSLNVAVPPFDDLHVRRAMYLAVDREAIASVLEGTADGYTQRVFTHLALDSYEDNLLLSYAPPGVGASPNVAAAREEMRQSRYDSDHDGLCDAPACSGAELVARGSDVPRVRAARALEGQLRDIGLHVTVKKLSDDEYFNTFGEPAARIALRMGTWFKDFPSGSTFLPTLLRSDALKGANLTMVGASPAQLREYGYSVRSVPSVDGQIDACTVSVFDAQTRCWAQLDQYLSEQLVPWVPLTQEEYGWLTSARVVEFAVDASIGVPVPALDNIRLKPGPAPPSPSGASPEAPASSIPDGVYRVTLSLDDIVRAGGAKDDSEDTGTFTVVMRDGRFLWHQRGDAPIFNPIGVGTYAGAGNAIRFRVEQPYFNAVSLSAVTWRLDGDNLVFTLPRCTGPAAQDPPFCGFQRAFFTAHPWERVPEVSGGPF
jgi:peptide/nickel transport system substrate-binding protein